MNTIDFVRSPRISCAFYASIVLALLGASFSHAENVVNATDQQMTFESPDAAFKEMLNCCSKDSDEALLGVLGRQHKDLVVQTDKEHSTEIRRKICSAAAEHLNIVTEGNKATAYLGLKAWPYPIPIVKQGDVWIFDTEAGKEEILNRRIGRNELSALKFLIRIVTLSEFTGAKISPATKCSSMLKRY
jgi:uncharacterized protein YbcI